MENKNKEKRVIELEVMEELEESGVSSIALVDQPAIEKYFVYMRNQEFVKPTAGESQSDFMGRCVPVLIDEGKEQDQAVAVCISMYEQEFSKDMEFESYTDYPESATEAAKRALAWAEENGWGDCGTPIGKARANQLANREAISEETIARMASFARHAQNADTPYSEGCGKLMWDAWGGTAGIEWASNKLESIREKMSYDTSGLPPYVEQTPKKKKLAKFNEYGCPEATVDIALNLANRQDAIEQANYGPLNPGEPNEEYWQAKADKFNTTVKDAKSAICGNCGFFVRTKPMLACIAAGIGEDAPADPYDAITAGELGYCEAFDFKCAAARTCDAWIGGGPILEEEEFIEPNPCWEGYEAIGLKDDGTPNCVPVKAQAFAERPIARIPKEERGRTGSEKNEPGDTKTSRGGIEVSQEVETTLKDKIKEHNEKNPQDSQKADLGMLKAVWRRGAGAYSVGTPGRKGMGRNQWAMGRVNAFLKILSGSAPSDKDYTQDNDLLPKSHPKHSEAMSKLAFAVEKDQQILVGPAMVPDMEILRRDEETGETYYVKFSKETIAKIQEKFMRETRLGATNLDHNEQVHGGSFVFESWLTEDDSDKANSVYKLGVPIGTWMVKMKVTDPKVWAMVKEGKYQGFSIEGNFIDKVDYEQIKSEKDLVESIMSILQS
jgi:hypothetical protein